MSQSIPTVQTVIRSLTDHLGPELMGAMCGMQGAAPLKKWLVRPPSMEEEVKLRTGYEAFRIIRRAEGADIARAWMMDMNPRLKDHRGEPDADGNPVFEIGLGYGRDVLMAARAYVQDPSTT